MTPPGKPTPNAHTNNTKGAWNQVMKNIKVPSSRLNLKEETTVVSIQESNRSSHTLPSVTPSIVPHSKMIELHKMAIISVRQKIDSQIVEYLNCTNYDPDKCVVYLRSAYKTIMEMPQLFVGRDVTNPEALRFWEVVNMAIFPKKSKDGYKIVYFGLKDPDPSHFNTVWSMKMYIMSLEAIVRSADLSPAYVFILDGKGMSLSHTPISQLRFLKKSIGFLQECSLVNMKTIHFVNASTIVERSYSVLRPFLNVNVTESLNFYSDGKMLAKVEDPAVLPPELGGTLSGTIEEYKEHLRSVVESNAPYFKEEEERRARKCQEIRKPSTI